VITNAAILRIDRRSGVSAAGDELIATGPTINVPCMMDGVSSSQKFTLGSSIEDSSNSLYIDKSDLAAANEAPLANGDRPFIAIDDEDPRLYEVLIAGDRSLNTLSHWELFLKVA
jgi:hypothetical protein